MMSGQPDREIIQELDYSVIHADDAFLQVGTDDCRIVFYQESLEVAEDRTKFNNDRKTIRLKCEVRVPFRAMKMLAYHASVLVSARDKITLDVNRVNDPELNTAWWKFNEKLGKMIADTRDINFDRKAINAYTDEFEAIQIRTARKMTKNETAIISGNTSASVSKVEGNEENANE